MHRRANAETDAELVLVASSSTKGLKAMHCITFNPRCQPPLFLLSLPVGPHGDQSGIEGRPFL
jgi:hypothetical protein